MSEQNKPTSILQRFAHLLSAQWLRELLNTVFLIALARTSSEFYGQYMVAFELGYIVLFVGEFGLNQALVTDLGKPSTNKGDVLARYTLIKGLLVSLGWSGAVAFSLWQEYDAGLLLMVLILGAGMAGEALASSFFVSCRVRGRQDLEARTRMVAAVAGYGFGLITLFLGAPAFVVASFKLIENTINLIGGVLVSLTHREMRNLRLRRKPMARTWRTARGGMVFVGLSLCAILYNKANIFFLQRVSGPDAVAQYAIAWGVVESFVALGVNIMLRNVLYPHFVELWHRDKEEYARLARTAVRWLTCIAIPVALFLALEADRIIPIIYGSQYEDAIGLQHWLAPLVLVAFLHNLAAYLMMSRGNQRVLLVIYSGGVILNLALCAGLIPVIPLLGTALAIIITRLAVGACTTFFCHKEMGLFSFKDLRPFFLVGALALVLWALIRPLGVRELSELALIAPFLVLGWRWWQQARLQKRSLLA